MGEAESSMSARAFETTSLVQVQPESGTLADTADSGVALAHLLDMVRGMCEMVRFVDSGRDAATLVRRARGLEQLVRTALKDCTVLEEEQFELRQEAAEAHVRTQRRAGELLSELQKHRGGRPSKTASSVDGVSESPPPTLRDLGIDSHESHRWQRIARVPEDVFEKYIATCRAKRTEITTANVLALARQLLQEQEEESSVDARPGSNAALHREYQDLRRYASNVIWLDPGGLAESMNAMQRAEALSELERLLLWMAEFRVALEGNGRLQLRPVRVRG